MYFLYGVCTIIGMVVKIDMIVIINIDIRDKLVVIIPLGVVVILNTPVEVVEIIIEVKEELKGIIEQVEKEVKDELNIRWKMK